MQRYSLFLQSVWPDPSLLHFRRWRRLMQEQPVSLTLRYSQAMEDHRNLWVINPDVRKQVGHLQQVHHHCTVEQRVRACLMRRTLNCGIVSLQLGRSRMPVLNLAILPPVGYISPYTSTMHWPIPPQTLCQAVRRTHAPKQLACKLDSHEATKESIMIATCS
jgi:hypothetical protein